MILGSFFCCHAVNHWTFIQHKNMKVTIPIRFQAALKQVCHYCVLLCIPVVLVDTSYYRHSETFYRLLRNQRDSNPWPGTDLILDASDRMAARGGEIFRLPATFPRLSSVMDLSCGLRDSSDLRSTSLRQRRLDPEGSLSDRARASRRPEKI